MSKLNSGSMFGFGGMFEQITSFQDAIHGGKLAKALGGTAFQETVGAIHAHSKAITPGLESTLSMMRASDSLTRVADLVRGLQASPEITRYWEGMTKMESALAQMFPADKMNVWRDKVSALVTPAATLLAQNPDFALLSGYPSDDEACLLWRSGSESDGLTADAIVEGAIDSGTPLTIELNIYCSFCKEPLILEGTNLSVVGPRRMRVDAPLVPLCRVCLAESKGDLGYYLFQRLHDRENPRPRLISRDGRTDGQPRGELYLVRDDSDDNGNEE